MRKPTERHLSILGLYYLTGLCVERVAAHVGCVSATVNNTIKRFGPEYRASLEEHHQNPKTIRGNRWDHSLP